MISNKKTRLYQFLRTLMYLASRLFYKEVAIKYVAPLPKDKPIIFVGNHLCTFNDPILISVNTGLYPAFLTRADVFKKPLVRRFLTSIRMLPIYRRRDCADFIERNEAIFDTSIKQLEANLQFVIFGEGSHSSFRRLRGLKKGFARIGFEALKRYSGEFELYIVPVGVEYSHFAKMHQTVTQTFGRPILLKKYWPQYCENTNQALTVIKDEVSEALQKLVIHIPSQEHYYAVESLRIVARPWLYQHLGLETPDPHQKMNAEQQMIMAQTAFEKEEPDEMRQFAQDIDQYHKELERLNFRNHLIHNSTPSRLKLMGQFVLMLPFFPLYLLGVITGYLPYIIPVRFTNRTFKDVMFHGPINMVGGFVSFLSFWLLETLLVQLIWHNELITLGFALLMPFSAWFAFRYWIQLKKWWHKWRYASFSKRKPEKMVELKEAYERVIEKTEEMLEKYKAPGD